jgi:putative membrane protein
MKNLKLLTLALAIMGMFACLQSCKDDDDYQMDDQDFVTQASSSNNFEIAAGTLATSKSQNVLVQQFGTHMIQEHSRVGEDMRALAGPKDLNVPEDLQPKEQTNLNTLTARSGEDFDASFVDMMVISHQETIDLFERASSKTGTRDGDLRNFAADRLPALREHLQQAQALQKTLNP